MVSAQPIIEADQVTVEEDGIRVTVGETIEIFTAPSRCAYTSAKKLENGDVIVSLPWPRDGRDPVSKVSSDFGQTWSDATATLSYDGGATFDPNQRSPILERFVQLSDGSIMGFEFPKDTTHRVWQLNSDGSVGIRQSVAFFGMSSDFVPEHSIVELPNGELLASFMDLTTTKPSVVVAYSANDQFRGRKWTYRSTVAIDTGDITQEGYVEPRLEVAENGDILAFLRTGNSHLSDPGSIDLVLTRSSDNGATWSPQYPAPLDELAPAGVYPNSVKMSDGTIALTYGRPGNWLAFSKDDGQSWINQFNVIDTQAPDCSSYNSIIELSPGNLLMVYGQHSSLSDYNTHVLGTYITVETIGDYDIDGDVDGADFLTWQRDPDVGDLADWEAYYGNSAVAAVATATVPEPSPIRIVLFLAISILVNHRNSDSKYAVYRNR